MSGCTDAVHGVALFGTIANRHSTLGLAHSCTSDVLSAVQQYYKGKNKHKYIPVAAFADAFQKTGTAKRSREYLEQPYQAPNKKCEEALITHHYALSCESAHLSAATKCLAQEIFHNL